MRKQLAFPQAACAPSVRLTTAKTYFNKNTRFPIIPKKASQSSAIKFLHAPASTSHLKSATFILLLLFSFLSASCTSIIHQLLPAPSKQTAEQKLQETEEYKRFGFIRGKTTMREVEALLSAKRFCFASSIGEEGAVLITECIGRQEGPFSFLFSNGKLLSFSKLSFEGEKISEFRRPTVLYHYGNFYVTADSFESIYAFKSIYAHVFKKEEFKINLSQLIEKEGVIRRPYLVLEKKGHDAELVLRLCVIGWDNEYVFSLEGKLLQKIPLSMY
ncbi:MAG: hypothetical protein ABIH99_03250 [Candidatus Micrarchaeota archaeon]